MAMTEPVQLEFDIDDGVPSEPSERVLYVGNFSHWTGKVGTIDTMHQRIAYVQFDGDIVVVPCFLHILRRLAKKGGGK